MARLVAVGASLPRVSFRQVSAPGMIGWNQGTLASVIFVPHEGPCAECARYSASLGSAVAGLREWATRAMVLVPPATESPATESPPIMAGIVALADEGGSGRALLGVGADQAAVVQADRWGAVYQVEMIGPEGDGHRHLPAPADLVALAQFVDIQCPECEVPSKEWRGLTPFPLG